MSEDCDVKYTCPVCGFPDLEEVPRSETGGGSYEICRCCGFQFGITDDDRGVTYEQWRARWVAGGLLWDGIGIDEPPENWDAEVQLSRHLSS